MSTDSSTRTVIGHSTADKVVLYGGLPLAGLALGFFLPRIADWAVDQRWVPFRGPLELIAKGDGERHDQLKSEAKALPAAFRAHGYPWLEAGDPHAGGG